VIDARNGVRAHSHPEKKRCNYTDRDLGCDLLAGHPGLHVCEQLRPWPFQTQEERVSRERTEEVRAKLRARRDRTGFGAALALMERELERHRLPELTQPGPGTN
jgi:hypothetical protein